MHRATNTSACAYTGVRPRDLSGLCGKGDARKREDVSAEDPDAFGRLRYFISLFVRR